MKYISTLDVGCGDGTSDSRGVRVLPAPGGSIAQRVSGVVSAASARQTRLAGKTAPPRSPAKDDGP